MRLSQRSAGVLICLLLFVTYFHSALYALYKEVDSAVRRLKFNQRLPEPDADVERAAAGGWRSALDAVRTSERKHVVISVAFGLGNRLRALASAMAVAAASSRPLLVVWPLDEHCNCSFRELFAAPLPFALVEEAVPLAAVRADKAAFQAFSYMKGDDGAQKAEFIHVDPGRHLYVRSAFAINHARGVWSFAKYQLRSLRPSAWVAERLVASSEMVGLHVRSVFDAPRASGGAVTGSAAVADAQSEYGVNESQALLEWRARGTWPNFVARIAREPADTRFYLAADSEDAYAGLFAAFPGRMLRTPRPCPAERCDFRDAAAIKLALVDMLNLARTRRILGSFYSSFSEVARFYGRADWRGKPLPGEFAGVHFGVGIDNVSTHGASPLPGSPPRAPPAQT